MRLKQNEDGSIVYLHKETGEPFDVKFVGSNCLVRPQPRQRWKEIRCIPQNEFLDEFEEYWDKVGDVIRFPIERRSIN